jgi:alpha-L-fucosidase
MGWPADGKATIRSLAKFPGVTAKIDGISLLGSKAEIKYTHDGEGLTVQLPAEKPCNYAVALKITGQDLRGFKPELAVPQAQAILPDGKGVYTLGADEAELKGGLKTENKGGQPNIGFWDNGNDSATWKVSLKQPGKYTVTASCSRSGGESSFVVEAAGQKLPAIAKSTGSWDKFAQVDVGTLEIKQAGDQTVTVHPADAKTWKAMNLRWLKLTPVQN